MLRIIQRVLILARIKASNAENYGMLIGGLILMGFGSTGTLFPSVLFHNHLLTCSCSHRVYPKQALLPLVPRYIPWSRICCRHRLEPNHLGHCQKHGRTHVNHQWMVGLGSMDPCYRLCGEHGCGDALLVV